MDHKRFLPQSFSINMQFKITKVINSSLLWMLTTFVKKWSTQPLTRSMSKTEIFYYIHKWSWRTTISAKKKKKKKIVICIYHNHYIFRNSTLISMSWAWNKVLITFKWTIKPSLCLSICFIVAWNMLGLKI
jgi:hypothetical protein